jgi:hypothetical protein
MLRRLVARVPGVTSAKAMSRPAGVSAVAMSWWVMAAGEPALSGTGPANPFKQRYLCAG